MILAFVFFFLGIFSIAILLVVLVAIITTAAATAAAITTDYDAAAVVACVRCREKSEGLRCGGHEPLERRVDLREELLRVLFAAAVCLGVQVRVHRAPEILHLSMMSDEELVPINELTNARTIKGVTEIKPACLPACLPA